ncbi:MAG: TadE/TadG family protein [Hyphomicrobiaceae bacterium]|nr:TadE/TadG family protein [Hyphomicrobiaceae bacterium]
MKMNTESAETGRSALSRFGSARSIELLKKLRRDESGDIAIMFGMLAVTMMMFVGSAVDLSRWLSARTTTLTAVDAAVLAGAKALQTGATESNAVAAAEEYYQLNTTSRTAVEDTIAFKTARNGTALQATGSASINTPFLSFAGIDRLPLVKLSNAEFAEAVVAVGGNSETSLEVSMMLDVTGSMGGSKIADLKEAAKDLIDIVVWENQSEFSSRVALVPFSEAVRLPDTLFDSVKQSSTPSKYKFKDWWGDNRTWKFGDNCVTERTGSNKFTDAAPTSSSDKVGIFYDSNGSCTPSSAKVVPLSSDKEYLKAQIDAYQASGNTAGHLGTAWAWYTLSPNWASVLPDGSKPESYSKLTELNTKGKAKLRKIAVLMTDGVYNTEYCKNVTTNYINCNSPNGDSAYQAAQLCTAMKAKGISVYTVGFALGNNTSVINLLRNCATDPTQAYTAESGEQLRQAFRDIALKISDLYLSK